MKTERKTSLVVLLGLLGMMAAPVIANVHETPIYVDQLIKCHEAKFDFDDAVGQLNGHLTQDTVFALSGYIHTGVPTEVNPAAKTVAIKAPFTASAPTFVTDRNGVMWACMTLNKK